MTQFQDNDNVYVDITRGGAASPTTDAIAKMLWLEGFSHPVALSPTVTDYAVVTKDHVQMVLTNLYKVEVPANYVLRYLRQVGLIKYAPALTSPSGPMKFRYTCANAARGLDARTIEDVDRLIELIAAVNAMYTGERPVEPDEDDDPSNVSINDAPDVMTPVDSDNIHDNECAAHWNEDAPCNCSPHASDEGPMEADRAVNIHDPYKDDNGDV